LTAVTKALADNKIFWEGCLLKPAMVTPGAKHPTFNTIDPNEVGRRTVIALSRTIPPAMVSINFLSGGMSEEAASLNLNACNKV